MKKTALLLICIIATTTLFAQKVFEGHISYSFKISGEGVEMYESMMPNSMNLYSSKKAMMIQMKGGMMEGMMGDIVSTPKESFMIKHNEETAYLFKDDEAKEESPKVVKEDEVITINGLSCQKYKVTKITAQGEQTAYIWLNSDYKLPAMGSKGAENMSVPGIPGIAMKTMTSTGGLTVVLTVSKFTKGKQDKKLFTIPKSYAKKDYDPNAMLGF